MKAVLFHPFSNPPTTRKLVDHIRRLSGVEVLVIKQTEPDPDPSLPIGAYPNPQNAAFRHACDLMDEPFVWLEQDSIPITSDWLDNLKLAWMGRKKDTLAIIPRDFQSPFDMYSGIGIYDPAVGPLIPYESTTGFDYHIAQVPSIIERTDLIQHAYGWYDESGMASRIQFPRDKWILRDTTVIFHADKDQTLITDA